MLIFNKFKAKIFIFSQTWGKKLGLDLSYFVSSGFWMTMRQGIEIASGVILLVIFARFTTKEVFGQYQLIISIFNIISILSLPGINTAVLRSSVRGFDGDFKSGVKSSFFWSLLGVPCLLATGVYYYHFSNHAVGLSLMISSIFFPLFFAPNTWPFLLQGKKLYKELFIFNSVRAALNTAVTSLIVLTSEGSLIPIITTYFLSYSFFSLLYYKLSLKYVDNDKKDPEMLSYGKFITKVSAFNLLAENADRIIISFMLSVSDVAIFSIVSLAAIKMRSFINPVLSIVFPKMVSERFRFGDIWDKKKKVIGILALIAIIPGIVFYLLIEKINLLFFGQGYEDFYVYSKIFVIFVILTLPLSLASSYVMAKKMTRAIFYCRPLYFFVKIFISIIFIRYWGLLGAVWAYNISTAVLFIIYLVLIKIEGQRFKED